jgi:hypothetical protein
MNTKPTCLDFILRSVWIAVAGVFLAAWDASASPITFTIDSTQSQVALTGTVDGATIQAQGTASLTNFLSGSINADLTASSIQFETSNGIVGENNGTWQPAVGGGSGSAPANFGGEVHVSFVTAYAAIRNAFLSLNSSPLALSGGNFDSTQLIFGLTNGCSMDYNIGGFSSGTTDLTGLSTNSVADGAALTASGSVKTITIQINTTFNITRSPGAVLTLTGKIVATNAPSAVFMINSVGVTNKALVLTVQNATAQSALQSSANLTTWSPATATVTTNSSGATFFSVPIGTGNSFFRVQQ